MKAGDARVLVTGASGGIGRATVEALLRAGAAVLVSGRAPDRLATLAPDLRRCTGAAAERGDGHAADLTRAAHVAALARRAEGFGVDVVVHAAGMPAFGRLESAAPGDLERLLATNLLAPMLLTRELLPHLRQRPRAQVMFVGSALGRLALPGFSAYSASKFGLRGFAEALRRELASTGVRVQYLGPRSTRTGFNDAAVEAYNRATGTTMDDAATVAAAVLRLLESEAAERYLGWPETLAVRLNGLAPARLDAAFARHRRSLDALDPVDPPSLLVPHP
jgi:short-subunit dehydrogenase